MRGKSRNTRLDFDAETRKSANYDLRFDISADFAVSESAQPRYKSASFAGFLARHQPRDSPPKITSSKCENAEQEGRNDRDGGSCSVDRCVFSIKLAFSSENLWRESIVNIRAMRPIRSIT